MEGGGGHTIHVQLIDTNRIVAEGDLRRVRFLRGWRYSVRLHGYGIDPVHLLEVRIDVRA